MATAKASLAAPPPEEDYIDMELTSSSSSSSSNLFCYSIESPPQSRDFEFQFQMTSFSGQTEPATSPADELFYKGKLLPLHLPPRLQMVQKLLHSPSSQNPSIKEQSFSQNFPIPLISIAAPLESGSFSPTESCRPSCELNPDEYLLGWRGEEDPPRKSWSKKMKQLKNSSQAYFKAMFGKSGCSNKSSAKSVFSEETEGILGSSGQCDKVLKKNPFGKIDYNKWKMPNSALEKEKIEEFYGGILNNHRRSFSGAIQRNFSATNNKSPSSSSSSSASSSGSSSFSFSSNGFSDLQLFKRSISASSEIESSIEGAIAHCKESQKLFGSSRKNEGESQVETCSLSASKIFFALWGSEKFRTLLHLMVKYRK